MTEVAAAAGLVAIVVAQVDALAVVDVVAADAAVVAETSKPLEGVEVLHRVEVDDDKSVLADGACDEAVAGG